MNQLMPEEPSIDYAMDRMSIDEAIAYLQSLKERFIEHQCVLSYDCVDEITGASALNLYSVDKK
jgi:hypothetical protein